MEESGATGDFWAGDRTESVTGLGSTIMGLLTSGSAP